MSPPLMRDAGIIAVLLLVTSVFLVFRAPLGDTKVVYDVVHSQLSHGTDTYPPTTLPDRVFALGKDGNAHYIAEYAVIQFYKQLARAGQFLDFRLAPSGAWWSAEMSAVALPHLLILPMVGCLLFFTALRLGCRRASSIWICTLGLASTYIPYYTAPFTRDGLGLPLSLAAFYCALSFRQSLTQKRWLWAVAAGVFAGISILFKMTAGTIALPLGLYIALGEWLREGAKTWRRVLFFLLLTAAPVIMAILALFLRNWMVFGIISGLPDSKPSASLLAKWIAVPVYQGLHGLLFSPGKGIFWYCPLAWLVFAAWPQFRKEWPLEALFFLLHLLAIFSLVVTFEAWPGDHGWGPRYLLTAVPWLLLILSFRISRAGSFRVWALTTIVAIAGFLVQLPSLILSTDCYFRLFSSQAPEYLYSVFYWVPSLSPIVVNWKILLAHWSGGRFFSHSPIGFVLPATAGKPIDFGIWYTPRETFWNEVVIGQWHLGFELAVPILAVLALLAALLLRLPQRIQKAKSRAALRDSLAPGETR